MQLWTSVYCKLGNQRPRPGYCKEIQVNQVSVRQMSIMVNTTWQMDWSAGQGRVTPLPTVNALICQIRRGTPGPYMVVHPSSCSSSLSNATAAIDTANFTT